MKVLSRVHFSAWLALVCLFTVSALPASRNFTIVKLFPSPIEKKDLGGISLPPDTGKGVMADQKSAFLGKYADAFRFHRPGFEHVPGSVSLESAAHPGFYLRYKNYKFHLVKANPSGVFEKDATFVERKTQTKGASAYELFNHPGWFMCHDTKSTFGLVAKKLEIGSNEFLVGCLYMVVAQNPAPRKNLVGKTVEEEDASSRESIHNITGIISNDVSVENLAKQRVGNESASQVNQTTGHVLGKKNGTAKNNQSPSKLPSNSTPVRNNTVTKTIDKALVNKAVANSTKQATHSNDTKQTHDQKNSKDARVTNVTQNTQMLKTGLQNKVNGMADGQKGKQPVQRDKKKMQDLTAGILQSTNNRNKYPGAKPKNPDSGSTDEGSVAEDLQNALQGAFMAAKQPAQTGLSTAQNPNLGRAGNPELKELNQQQKDQSGQHPPAPNKNGPKNFDLNFELPNSPNQGNILNALSGPAQFSFPGQLAQITAKALGLVQNTFKNQGQRTQQMVPHYRKGAADLPLLHQLPLQQQPRALPQPFRRPLPYLNQYMPHQATTFYQHTPPQASLGGPNLINMPVHSGRPQERQFAVKSPAKTRFTYRQVAPLNRGYSYRHPWKIEWKGIASVGKQSLEGNRVQFQHNAQGTAQNFQHKTIAKLNDDSKDLGKQDKCISLKFINKVRKPIQLVSSMKLGGYLITAETFKLKTIFKHPRKHHHVIFYARDADDKDNEVMLNNNNAIAVTPGGCDLPFRTVLLSHHGQISNDEIEHLRAEDEYEGSKEAARKAVRGDENFSQWTAFGACAASCGRSIQTRTRYCLPGKVCMGKTLQTRTCIQTPCPVTPCLKTNSGKCCALPFVYRGAAVNRCLVDPQTHLSWCATTPNFDKEKRWGYCQPTDHRTQSIAPVYRSYLPRTPGQTQPLTGQCSVTCERFCMNWCPQHCCITAKHR